MKNYLRLPPEFWKVRRKDEDDSPGSFGYTSLTNASNPAHIRDARLFAKAPSMNNLPSPGLPYDRRWYVGRTGEKRAGKYLEVSGTPVVVEGAIGYGKTWFLEHVLEARRGAVPCRTVRVDLAAISRQEPPSLSRVLHAIASQILLGTKQGLEKSATNWSQSRSPQSQFSKALENSDLLRDHPLLVALDEADAISGFAFQDDFFGFLRSLAGERQVPWSNLRLLMTITRSSSSLIRNVHQSPFNLTTPIALQDLEPSGIHQLAILHGLAVTDLDIEELMGMVGGHPYLVRMALYEAASRKKQIRRLLGEADFASRLYRDFLRQHHRGEKQADWLHVLQQLLHDPHMPLALEVADELERAGLIVRNSNTLRLRFPSLVERIGPARAGVFHPLVLGAQPSTEMKSRDKK